MKASVGGILNKFKGKSRRNVLFFEDILADYIKECENSGHGNGIKNIGEKWGYLVSHFMIPKTLKHLPPSAIFILAKGLWINLGLLDDLIFKEKKDKIEIKVKNAYITRIIGENKFVPGTILGALNYLYNSQLDHIKSLIIGNYHIHNYIIRKNEPLIIEAKDKTLYDKLNKLENYKGYTLKDVLKMNLFQLKENNRIYFRDKLITPIENTLFHVISNKKIKFTRISHISYNYFVKIIKKDTPKEQKLRLLKTLLEAMGWGNLTIITSNKKIKFTLKNPPYGLQTEKNDWEFLGRVVLGYLWLVDKKFKISKISESYRRLEIIFSK